MNPVVVPVATDPETRDYPSREATREPARGSARESQSDRYGYDEPASRPSRRRPTAPARDVYDEWDDTLRTASRPRRRPVNEPPVEPTIPTESPRRRPRPADLGRSYEPDDTYNSADDLGSSYDDDTDLGRSYEPDDEPSIPGDYVVDYQPLDNQGNDYEDNDYDDSDDSTASDYDDYDELEDSGADDDYDDYSDRTERRTPINLNNNNDYNR